MRKKPENSGCRYRTSEYLLEQMIAVSWIFNLKFIADPPYSGDGPGWMILDLFTETFDMYVYGAGVADIFIAPDVIQKLFPGKYLVGRGCQEIEKLQFLWRHVHGVCPCR